MRLTICITAALVLGAGPTQLAAKSAAPFTINHTSWAFVDKGKKVHETIDADGNYIENAVSGKHIDHGTSVMKDGNAPRKRTSNASSNAAARSTTSRLQRKRDWWRSLRR